MRRQLAQVVECGMQSRSCVMLRRQDGLTSQVAGRLNPVPLTCQALRTGRGSPNHPHTTPSLNHFSNARTHISVRTFVTPRSICKFPSATIARIPRSRTSCGPSMNP